MKMLLRSDTHIDLFDTEDTKETTTKVNITRTQILSSLAVSMGSMIVGYSSAWSSPAIADLMEPGSYLEVSKQEASWIGSLMPLAALAGGLVGGSFLEVLGRKTTILMTSIPFMGAGLLVTYAQDVNMIYVGRAISGFCIGIVSLSLPVYLAEAIQPEVRGILGILPTTLGNGGVMLCYILGFWLDWSHLALVSAVLPLFFLFLMCIIPETPRYLIARSKPEKARAALQWLRGPDYDITTEFATVETTILLARKNKLTPKELLNKSYLRPFIVSTGLMLFQQLSGINAVMFYSVSIFKDAGSSVDSNVATIILGIVNIGATIISNILIDRLGRKVLLYISNGGMIVSLAVFGMYFYLKDDATRAQSASMNLVERSETVLPGWIPLMALMIYVVSFSLGFGPIPWLMMGEVFPSRIRGAAASIATALNWAFTFIVTKTFMDLQSSIGTYGVFWMFGLICTVSVFFVFFIVPETRGKTLEEIENLFSPSTHVTPTSSLTKRPARRLSSRANLKATPSTLM